MAVRRSLGIFLAIGAWYYGITVKTIIIFGLLVLTFLFVVVPIFFRWCATLQRHMVFLPWVYWPKHVNFNRPDNEGLSGALNFYLETDKNVEVGVWHILPERLANKSIGKSREWFEQSLGSGDPIILYLHGNTGSRAREHRLGLYRVLQRLNYHIVCFDYRGYADSSPVMPTKTGVVTDALGVFDYVKKHSKNSTVVVYGHSLGTAVSCEAVNILCNTDKPPSALILESPFNNIHEEVKIHPMSFLWRKMPMFDFFFTGALTNNDVGFVSDQKIKDISVPILILHAKDDMVVPFVLGEKLYKAALASRSTSIQKVKFVPFEEDRCLGHIHIHTAEEFPQIISSFVSEVGT